ncbi:MAG: hypothetical protein COA64_12685, partial [Henriciella sp.]
MTWKPHRRGVLAGIGTASLSLLAAPAIVLYAAGVMPKIDVDTYDFAKDRKVIDVNLLGCIAWLNQA